MPSQHGFPLVGMQEKAGGDKPRRTCTDIFCRMRPSIFVCDSRVLCDGRRWRARHSAGEGCRGHAPCSLLLRDAARCAAPPAGTKADARGHKHLRIGWEVAHMACRFLWVSSCVMNFWMTSLTSATPVASLISLKAAS